jgi:hypothetical protein
MSHLVTVAELAAFLGLSTSRIRHVIAQHAVPAQGQRWKAKLYDPVEVLRHAGPHDRLLQSVQTPRTLTRGQVCLQPHARVR